jgi:hypothetical protein
MNIYILPEKVKKVYRVNRSDHGETTGNMVPKKSESCNLGLE